MSKAIVLAIETSCDETAVSVVESGKNGLKILSDKVSSQVKLHAKWGGVVPNLAAREHVKNITHLLELSLRDAGTKIADIDAIAVTQGPGLIPALMVGAEFAKTLAYLWEKPLLGIHHIEGHIYANFIREISNDQFPMTKKSEVSLNENCKLKIENSDTTFPVLALVVSGGHTQLVFMKDHLQYEIIGQTVDDAVGEAFDKVARILGIGYPGGPAVAQQAANFQFPISNFQKDSNDSISKKNTGYKIQFPRPMLNKQNFNFSFSGLKTAVLYEVKKFTAAQGSSTPTKGVELPRDYVAEVCHEFQQACIDVLVAKTIKAAGQYTPKTIMLAGGVSANTELRKQLGEKIKNELPGVLYNVPDLSLTGDNAAMIGAAAAFRWGKMSDAQKKKALSGWKTLHPDANLKMK